MNVMSTQPLLLGFPRLEDLAAQEILHNKVYLSPVAELGTGGISISYQTVEIQALIDDGLIGYWRFHVGNQTLVNGVPGDDKLNALINKATEDVIAILDTWLHQRHGFLVTRARFATPRDYVYMRGSCDFLTFDPKAKTYVTRPEEPPPIYGGRFA